MNVKSSQIVIVVLILITGFFGSRYLGNIFYRKWTANLNTQMQAIQQNYRQQISMETDAYLLTQKGLRLLNVNNPELAIITLSKATEIEPEYRDAWIYLGVARLKTNESEKAVICLENAREIDPINSKIYDYLSVAYSQTGNDTKAKEAAAKQMYFSKK